MFNWFKRKEYIVPEVEKPKEEPERTYLLIGPTSKGRVALRLRYSEITMDEIGINSLIKSLEASKAWLNPTLESGKQPEDGCQEEETPV